MSNQIEVTKIEINVRGKILSLTPDEMRELKDVLEKAFPSKAKQVEKHIHHHDAYWPVYQPVYHDPVWPKWDHWKITCSTGGVAQLSIT